MLHLLLFHLALGPLEALVQVPEVLAAKLEVLLTPEVALELLLAQAFVGLEI